MDDSLFEFNRGAIRPVECFKSGWQLINEDYWQFWGIFFVGMLIAGAVPFGLLMGPMMCGIHLCLFRKLRGRDFNFNLLFDGLQYFGPSFVATLFALVPQLLLGVGGYIAMMATFIGFLVPMQQQARGGPPDLTGLLVMFGVQIGLMLVITGVGILIQALLFFAYPLIVDRRMTGWQAVKTSARACLGNLGGMIGLMIIETIVVMIGLAIGCVGIYFVFPLTLAARTMAYRQVFPEQERRVVVEEDELPGDFPEGDEPAPRPVIPLPVGETPPSTGIREDKAPGEFRAEQP